MHQDRYSEQKKSYTVEEATLRLERYCAYQERCHQEVKRKLRELNMIPDAVDHILTHLIQQNYLNETRFAQAFVRGKFRQKKWGKRRLKQELKLREISAYNIKKGFEEISEAEYNTTFHTLAEKRWQQLRSETNTQNKKRKFVTYLQYRGWETAKIWEKYNDLTN